MEIIKEKNFVSAVVYIHNNADVVESFLNQVNDILHENFETYEIICVDDASSDNSIQQVKRAADRISTGIVSLVSMSFYQGVECSMNAGVDLSIGDFVFEFDTAYMDYEPGLIMQVYRHSLTGYDIVSASPKHISKKSSRMFYYVFNKYSDNAFKLSTETFRVLSRRAINRVETMSTTIPYRKAVYATSGLKVDSVLYDNPTHRSKIDVETQNSRKDTAVDTLMLFTDVAYKVSLFLSFLMLLFTLSTAVYTVVVYFGQSRPVAGWAPLMGFLSVGFFGVFLILTIVIRHLNLILKLIFKKQKYLISSIEKLK